MRFPVRVGVCRVLTLCQIAALGFVAQAGCSTGGDRAPSSREPVGQSASWLVAGGALTVQLPARADEGFRLTERRGVGVRVSLEGARPVAAKQEAKLLRFPGGDGGGGEVELRRTEQGIEDWVELLAAPSKPVRYRLRLEGSAAGLRLVSGVLEVLDAQGSPRLRARAPWLLDAQGKRHEARFAVAGCSIDQDPRAPWGRPAVAPGASECDLEVDWDRGAVAYPARLDPAWTSADSMSTARGDVASARLLSGLILVVGGQSSASGGIAPGAELYNSTTRTWASTGAPAEGYLRSAVRLGDGRVLVAGGFKGGVSPGNTSGNAELYNPATGTWSFTGAMLQKRYLPGLVALSNGSAMAFGNSVTQPGSRTPEMLDLTKLDWVPMPDGPFSQVALAAATQGLPAKALFVSPTGDVTFFTPAALPDGAWSAASALGEGREQGALVTIPGGDAFLLGGFNPENGSVSSSMWRFTASNGKWLKLGEFKGGAVQPGALLDADGTILAVGGRKSVGYDQEALTATFQLNSVNGTSTQGPSLNKPRSGHALYLLSNNDVVAIGGFNANEALDSVEVRGEVPADLGEPCSAASQCISGFCVDNVCCDGPCNGGCMACSSEKKGGGQPGICGFTEDNTDPDGDCAKGQPLCDQDGLCDGKGQCRGVPGAGTPCGAQTCSSLTTLTRFVCNGSPGGCVPTPVSCGNYICESDECRTSCGFTGDCNSAFYCKAGACVPKLTNGQVCSLAEQCSSGFCVDGVCCNTACAGTCQACSAAAKGSGASGVCGLAKAGTDPRNQCDDQLANSCGKNGLCDGAGACQIYAAGTPCKAPSCAGTQATAAQCNGTGLCVNLPPIECAPALCDTGACRTSCSSTADCAGSGFCSNGQCTPKRANGQTCGATAECASGFCVDGLCCESACSGECETCSEPASPGTCVGKPPTTPCGVQQICQGASSVYSERCDGNKSCVSIKQSCGLFVCDANACKTSCDTKLDCTADAYCDVDTHTCKSKLANGLDCASSIECDSGFCVDGVCCNSSCSGPCQACNEPQTKGSCSTEPAGTACGLDSCDGSGIIHRACSVSGNCVETKESCNGFACVGATCTTSCSVDTDCDASAYCDGGTCKLKQPNSASCSSGKDCQSGFCIGGVCCNTLCPGSCVACNLPSSPGICSPTVQGTPCGAPAACDADSVVASSCDGLGTCEKTSTSCGLYQCNAGVCADSCASDADCKEIGRCQDGKCVGKTPNGQACGSSLECTSGFCVDGLCCNTACGGICGTCNDPSSLGTCVPTAQGTACGADVCNENDSAVSSSCDGQGTCKESTKSCGLYRCNEGACGGSCASDVDCKETARCQDGKCVAKTPNGQACGSSLECASGFCVDGLCCNTACGGICGTCNDPSSLGTCVPTAQGTACGANACNDGDNLVISSCDGQGTCKETTKGCGLYHCEAGACGESCASDADCKEIGRCQDGKCVGKTPNGQACGSSLECTSGFCVDGLCCNTACGGVCNTCNDPSSLGTCVPSAQGTACGADVCNENDSAVSSSCDGQGTCKESTKSCGLYRCNEGACGESCASDVDCKETGRCQGGKCVAKTPNGQACGSSLECASGFCVDGVCCDKACQGQCEACDVKGFEGKCIPAQGNPHGSRPACASPGDVCQAARCDGVVPATCAGLPGPETSCGEASCKDGVLTRASVCSGSGACKAPEKVLCEPYLCDGSKACKTSCDADDDCSAGAICDRSSSKCVNGAKCSDEDTLRNADGSATECAPYKCAGSSCRAQCVTSADCSTGNVCYSNGTCAPVSAPNAPVGADDGGCGCRAAGSPSPSPSPLLGLALAALALRRRRRSEIEA